MAGNGTGKARMGHYHDGCGTGLLDRRANTCLLGHNLRITPSGNTLGELDMLYRQGATIRRVHLEVAINFYLGLPDGPGEGPRSGEMDRPRRADVWPLKMSSPAASSAAASRQRRWRSTP